MFSEWIWAIWYLARPCMLQLKDRLISLLWRHYDVIIKKLFKKTLEFRSVGQYELFDTLLDGIGFGWKIVNLEVMTSLWRHNKKIVLKTSELNSVSQYELFDTLLDGIGFGWKNSQFRGYDVIIKKFRPNNFRNYFSKSIRVVWYLTQGYAVMFILRAFFSIMTS